MSDGLLSRLVRVFIDPPPDVPETPLRVRPPSPGPAEDAPAHTLAAPRAGGVAEPAVIGAERLIGVLAPPPDLASVAGGVAATLRRATSARTVVVCSPADPPARRLTHSRARAAARKLAARELTAVPAGALCHVVLDADPAIAVRQLGRVAAAVDVPLVLALPGRLDGFDGLLAVADQLVLAAPADAEPALVDLALASLTELGRPAGRTVPPTTPFKRHLAALGLATIALDMSVDVAAPPAEASPTPAPVSPALEPPLAAPPPPRPLPDPADDAPGIAAQAPPGGPQAQSRAFAPPAPPEFPAATPPRPAASTRPRRPAEAGA